MTSNTLPKAKYADLGGLRVLAENLHFHFGRRIVCPNCPAPDEPARAYCKDEGGKGAEDGLKRRQFRCRDAVRRRKETGEGCATLSCPAYIRRAIEVIGEDEVDGVRRGIVRQLGDGGRDLSRITQRIQAKRRPHTPPPPAVTTDTLRASTETTARPQTRPPPPKGSDDAPAATDERRPKRGAGVFKRFCPTEVVPLATAPPAGRADHRKRARDDADETRAERVTKLARRARALIEEIEKENVAPADGDDTTSDTSGEDDPLCLPESDDEFSGLLRLL
ncbi:hypothetical protein KC316_g9605 [Hortaea werneckii]|nr:hypothetical protein KC324_g19561 [Hortaea werneckii]KAI7579017.1 hypothetical protein KC316_g9605 [Hortaea werneckii]